MNGKSLVLRSGLIALLAGCAILTMRSLEDGNPAGGSTNPDALVFIAPSAADARRILRPEGNRGTAAPQGHTKPQPPGVLSSSTAAAPEPALFLSEQQLQRRAARVEIDANNDLRRLVDSLELDEAQQDRVFDALVRHSPYYLPAMQPVGLLDQSPKPVAKVKDGKSPAASGSESEASVANSLLDDIAAELNAEQQYELATAELDRREWWEDIIPQLLLIGDTFPVITSLDSDSMSAVASPPVEESFQESKDGGNPPMLEE